MSPNISLIGWLEGERLPSSQPTGNEGVSDSIASRSDAIGEANAPIIANKKSAATSLFGMDRMVFGMGN